MSIYKYPDKILEQNQYAYSLNTIITSRYIYINLKYFKHCMTLILLTIVTLLTPPFRLKLGDRESVESCPKGQYVDTWVGQVTGKSPQQIWVRPSERSISTLGSGTFTFLCVKMGAKKEGEFMIMGMTCMYFETANEINLYTEFIF